MRTTRKLANLMQFPKTLLTNKMKIILLLFILISCAPKHEQLDKLKSDIEFFSSLSDDEVYKALIDKNYKEIFGSTSSEKETLFLTFSAPGWNIKSSKGSISDLLFNYPELNVGESLPQGMPGSMPVKSESRKVNTYFIHGKKYTNVTVHTFELKTEKGTVFVGYVEQS